MTQTRVDKLAVETQRRHTPAPTENSNSRPQTPECQSPRGSPRPAPGDAEDGDASGRPSRSWPHGPEPAK